MQAAVETITPRGRRHRRARQQRRLQPVGSGRAGAARQVSAGSSRPTSSGCVRLTQLVLPGMRARRQGRIVNIGSMGGRLTFPGGGVYHATKYALEALSDALRFEVAGFGIQVVLVQPGLIRTRFASAASASLDGLGPDGRALRPLHAEVERITRESYEKGATRAVRRDARRCGAGGRTGPDRARPGPAIASASASILMTLRALLPDRLWDASSRGPTRGRVSARRALRGGSRQADTVSLRRPLNPRYVVALRARGLHQPGVRRHIHVGRARQEPEVVPVGCPDDGRAVVGREVEDPVITPDAAGTTGRPARNAPRAPSRALASACRATPMASIGTFAVAQVFLTSMRPSSRLA